MALQKSHPSDGFSAKVQRVGQMRGTCCCGGMGSAARVSGRPHLIVNAALRVSHAMQVAAGVIDGAVNGAGSTPTTPDDKFVWGSVTKARLLARSTLSSAWLYSKSRMPNTNTFPFARC